MNFHPFGPCDGLLESSNPTLFNHMGTSHFNTSYSIHSCSFLSKIFLLILTGSIASKGIVYPKNLPWQISKLKKKTTQALSLYRKGTFCIYISWKVIIKKVKDVLLWKRHTQRKLATSMGLSRTTVHHWIVGLTICIHCNSLKPVLTEENKVERLLMVLHFRDPVDLTKYHDMLDWIHLDEKWFFLTQKKERLEEKT